ncbi:hypothetical protein DPMN_078896 [Dreissena polymorpha]|uniref:Uncharacterized protein n=1 Tax=Dreissena polymorpha TaxID=45954 RepID=A0A9D4BPJ9_DREPO|nr:hypothetical protein DPMN_078896 [Dreissena polymorpha]
MSQPPHTPKTGASKLLLSHTNEPHYGGGTKRNTNTTCLIQGQYFNETLMMKKIESIWNASSVSC